jgi:hypothetical protein
MRRGIKTNSRQSQPDSLLRIQRGVKTTLIGCNDPLTIKAIDTRTNEVMRVNVAQAVVATLLSWRALDRKASQSAIARELLDEGCVLANKKGVFVDPVRYRERRATTQKHFESRPVQRAA